MYKAQKSYRQMRGRKKNEVRNTQQQNKNRIIVMVKVASAAPYNCVKQTLKIVCHSRQIDSFVVKFLLGKLICSKVSGTTLETTKIPQRNAERSKVFDEAILASLPYLIDQQLNVQSRPPTCEQNATITTPKTGRCQCERQNKMKIK